MARRCVQKPSTKPKPSWRRVPDRPDAPPNLQSLVRPDAAITRLPPSSRHRCPRQTKPSRWHPLLHYRSRLQPARRSKASHRARKSKGSRSPAALPDPDPSPVRARLTRSFCRPAPTRPVAALATATADPAQKLPHETVSIPAATPPTGASASPNPESKPRPMHPARNNPVPAPLGSPALPYFYAAQPSVQCRHRRRHTLLCSVARQPIPSKAQSRQEMIASDDAK